MGTLVFSKRYIFSPSIGMKSVNNEILETCGENIINYQLRHNLSQSWCASWFMTLLHPGRPFWSSCADLENNTGFWVCLGKKELWNCPCGDDSFKPRLEKRFYMNLTAINADPFQSWGNFNIGDSFIQSQEKRVYMNLNAIDTDPFRNSDKLKIGWFFHTKTEERVLREFYYNSFIPIQEKRFYMNFTTIDTDPFQSSGNFNTNALGLRVKTHSLPKDHKQQQNVKALFSWYTFEQSWHK